MSESVLPAGRGVGAFWATRSAASAMDAPMSMASGMTRRWEDWPLAARAICADMIPTKPSGPQKAVTALVARQQPSRARPRVRAGCPPLREEKSSPKRARSSPLASSSDSVAERVSARAIHSRSWGRTDEKVPAKAIERVRTNDRTSVRYGRRYGR